MLAKVDEDLPIEITLRLRSAGWNALSVNDQNHSGATDDELWSAVVSEGRWLFTADKGFADVRRLSSTERRGIVLFRLPNESRDGYIQLLEDLLNKVNFEQMGSAVITVTPEMVRIHRTQSMN